MIVRNLINAFVVARPNPGFCAVKRGGFVTRLFPSPLYGGRARVRGSFLSSPDASRLAGLCFEELRERGSDGRCINIVGLTFQGAALCIWKGIGDCLRARAEPRTFPPVHHKRRNLNRSYPLSRQ